MPIVSKSLPLYQVRSPRAVNWASHSGVSFLSAGTKWPRTSLAANGPAIGVIPATEAVAAATPLHFKNVRRSIGPQQPIGSQPPPAALPHAESWTEDNTSSLTGEGLFMGSSHGAGKLALGQDTRKILQDSLGQLERAPAVHVAVVSGR
jgi:hypothetical protein